jgi:hypothetical protein
MCEQVVPLSELARDLPEPAAGWPVELGRRGVVVAADDLGRPAISRDEARVLYAEHREQEEEAARRREEIERRAVEADQRFRAALPRGIPAGQVPEGMTAGLLMMAADPMVAARRTSVVEDALAHAGTIYHPLQPEPVDQ